MVSRSFKGATWLLLDILNDFRLIGDIPISGYNDFKLVLHRKKNSVGGLDLSAIEKVDNGISLVSGGY